MNVLIGTVFCQNASQSMVQKVAQVAVHHYKTLQFNKQEAQYPVKLRFYHQ
jgi:hypothetical protein